jgi:transcriptional regulator with XRE-family HTH domain
MVDFGTRLRDERIRLGYSQTAFGAVGGVEKNTQSNYEHGKRSPDAIYLERISKIGADVHFLICGDRVFPDEQSKTFYDMFWSLTAEQKDLVVKLMEQVK